jgi:DNA-binding transcriptional LysR family regulator
VLDELKSIGIFAETVRQGSFRKAAGVLGLSPSVVSYHVKRLEKRIGSALFYRSTRKLSLTSQGERLFRHAEEMLSAARSGISELTATNQETSGKLKVALPHFLTSSYIVEKIAEFKKRHQKVVFEIYCSDERLSVIQEGIDVAFRVGEMNDSGLKCRLIAPIKRKLVCAPQYLDSMPPPASPSNLSSWNWISLAMLPVRRTFLKDDDTEEAEYQKAMIVNSVTLMTELTVQGLGLATPPDFLVDPRIENGELVEVLSDWRVKDIPVYAVWPENVDRQGTVQKFLKLFRTVKTG